MAVIGQIIGYIFVAAIIGIIVFANVTFYIFAHQVFKEEREQKNSKTPKNK